MSKTKSAKKISGRIIGIDVDNNGQKLYPGFPILYWTGDGRTEVKCWPGKLSAKQNDGTWSIIYFQRAMTTPSHTAKYSESPAIHTWTFIDAYNG